MASSPNGTSFTIDAWKLFYETVEDDYFIDEDAEMIYQVLEKKLTVYSFGDYLKRYIYRRAGLAGGYLHIDIREYQSIIKESFAENNTPASFTPTTAKISALSKNWLTQQTVNRSVVFLLGFGLHMSADDVSLLLKKALGERAINPRNPFEVLCWYSYTNDYGFGRFNRLWEQYQNAPPVENPTKVWNEKTDQALARALQAAHDESLLDLLIQYKTEDSDFYRTNTAKAYFDSLYKETKDVIGELYEKDPGSVSAADLENVLCSAIPKDKNGNLVKGKLSTLYRQFDGKRFSRQHINEIMRGSLEVSRYDLITLSFFLYSQKLEQYPDPRARYEHYLQYINEILDRCAMGGIYIPNAYECFVLMCILSEDPLLAYSDVWAKSYQEESKF